MDPIDHVLRLRYEVPVLKLFLKYIYIVDFRHHVVDGLALLLL